MANRSTHKASKDIAYCHDQGIPYLCGAGLPGASVTQLHTTFVAGGVYTFKTLGLLDMYDNSYVILVIDQTSGTVAAVTQANKRPTGFTISAGPTAGDSLDIVIIGRLKFQSGK